MTVQFKRECKVNPRAAEMQKVLNAVWLPYLRSGGRSVAKLTKMAKVALSEAGFTYEEYCALAGIRL